MLRKKLHGFTLVELLVVIAIIGILIALLLPAVQQVREAARRTECANHLRQSAMGLVNYQSNFLAFPEGSVAQRGAEVDGGFGHSFWVVTLPYLDQENLFENYDLEGSGFTGGDPSRVNRPVLADVVLPFLSCPSSPR